MSAEYYSDAIFWIDIEKINPNPYQPRKEFDPAALQDLSDSIRMYGLLQPLTVTRRESMKEDGGLAVTYELISGERRLRASKLAGLAQIPAIIRAKEEDARTKLELAIIENIQREDLNVIDRARAFQQLVQEFGFKHAQVAEKMGKSREYVTNSMRLLNLPSHMLDALGQRRIMEGHTRPLLMLVDRPDEQETLFQDILLRKLNVREAEMIARKIAKERARKKEKDLNPEIIEFESRLNEVLGTRVHIETKEQGGKIVIDYYDLVDLKKLLNKLQHETGSDDSTDGDVNVLVNENGEVLATEGMTDDTSSVMSSDTELVKDMSVIDEAEDGDMYNVTKFTI
ncbi:MAG: chromosome partitioning protein ParB, chromosome partitioning protein ParB family [Candidatus Parcubacteria bacterium]|jgi:ParB family chromosome partitioning protein